MKTRTLFLAGILAVILCLCVSGGKLKAQETSSAITPVLSWNTFLGGEGHDRGYCIAVDANGNTYVTGSSRADWGSPVRPYIGSTSYGFDAFVAKLDKYGNLLWNTFLGGNGNDTIEGIAIDGAGNCYVAGNGGETWESPVRPFAGMIDAFVAKLDSNGTLLWNTFLGNWYNDYATGVGVDTNGDCYVSGFSLTSWGSPIRPFSGGYEDAYVAKLDSNGVLQWNTFLGGPTSNWSHSIAVDANGNSYVSGSSNSTWGVPIIPYTTNGDAFVAKLDSNGILQWNTFLGGSEGDSGDGIALDMSGNCYVSGMSYATWGFPITSYSGNGDAFVAKLNTTGVLQWNTFVGGPSYEYGWGISVDADGSSCVTGVSEGTWGSPLLPFSGLQDAFVVGLDTNGIPQWNTFLGGVDYDFGWGTAMDVEGNAYVIGWASTAWGSPVRPYSEGEDAFVAKISMKLPYTFYGFDQPVDNQPNVNIVKAGSSIPLRWQLKDSEGMPISDPESFIALYSYSVPCESFQGEPAEELGKAPGSQGFSISEMDIGSITGRL